jgi:hypothetical protein
MTELPMMISSFDKSEIVNTNNISKTDLKNYLNVLFKALDLNYDKDYGWNKKDVHKRKSVGNQIISELLTDRSIIQPSELQANESFTLRSCLPKLLQLLDEFPDLISEMSSLFDNLIHGEQVQLSDIPNEDVVSSLSYLFTSIGLVANKHDGAFGLPSEKENVLCSLKHLKTIFKTARKFAKLNSMKLKSGDSSSSENDSDGSNSKHDSDTNEIRIRIGPSAPSIKQLSQAQLLKKVFY